MLTNTRAPEKLHISRNDFSKPLFRQEPYWFRSGHFVGEDGFVVPKNFQEFSDRYPNYVERWVASPRDSTPPAQTTVFVASATQTPDCCSMSKGNDGQPMRPAKGEVVLNGNRRRWKVIAIDVDDEGVFVQNRLGIRFVSWHQWEKHWRKVGHD